MEVEEPTGVLRDLVVDLRGRDAGRVHERLRERHLVRLVGQVLAEEAPVGTAAEMGLDVEVVVRAPHLRAGAARQGGVDRAERGREAPLRAADEAPPLVRLVELERLDGAAELALPALEVLVEEPAHVRERVHHQPLADEPRRVGQPVGMSRRAREEQQPGRPDRVRGEDDDLRRLEVLAPVAVEPRGAGGEAGRVRLDPADAGAGHEPGAEADRLRPVGEVGGRLGALVAALLAGASLDARAAAVVRRPRGSS